MNSWRVLVVFLFFTAAISVEAMGQRRSTAVTPGRWGGTGAEFVVDSDSVKIVYDCAVGEISKQLKIDARGNFVIDGFHRRIYPGALRTQLQPKPVPARYEGRLTGNKIKYRSLLIETGEVIGEFTVELGKEARIRRCR